MFHDKIFYDLNSIQKKFLLQIHFLKLPTLNQTLSLFFLSKKKKQDDGPFLAYKDIYSREFGSGLTIEEKTELEKNPWRLYESTRLVSELEVASEFLLSLSINEEEIDFDSLLDEEVGPLPAILFISSDEYTPFELTMGHQDDESFVVKLSGDGFNPIRITMERFE